MDIEWINEFEKEDKLYENFYKENIKQINICYFYIDESNDISNIIKEKYTLQKENILTKEELVYLIKHNCIKKEKKHRLLSILQYNYKGNTENIISNVNDMTDEENYLSSLHYINEVKWEPTIKFMHNLNTLYIIYYVSKKLKNSNTKKVKINLSSSNKKTRYKRT